MSLSRVPQMSCLQVHVHARCVTDAAALVICFLFAIITCWLNSNILPFLIPINIPHALTFTLTLPHQSPRHAVEQRKAHGPQAARAGQRGGEAGDEQRWGWQGPDERVEGRQWWWQSCSPRVQVTDEMRRQRRSPRSTRRRAATTRTRRAAKTKRKRARRSQSRPTRRRLKRKRKRLMVPKLTRTRLTARLTARLARHRPVRRSQKQT